MKTAIIYGSTTGNTEAAANSLKDALAPLGEVSVCSVTDGFGDAADADLVLLGSSTWGIGEMQDDWIGCEDLSGLDLSGKHVAVFGTGDQTCYTDTFVDAIGILAESAQKAGGKLIGQWPTEGYCFSGSTATREDKFVGLVLDEDNQSGLTDERITKWAEQLQKEMAE